MPGKSWPGQDSGLQLIPLPEDLRKQYEKDGGMKSLMMLLVVSIEFADGSKYSDEKVYKALKALGERVEIPVQ